MIICDDVLRWAETWEGEKFHAMLLDPPYHLTEIAGMQRHGSKRFGEPRTEAEKDYRRTGSRGFMGKDWDGGDIAFRPETWTALARHLLPGAFVMAFASSRGWHRLACAMEDAGLIIHPSIFIYAYGSGLPKATRIPDERFDGHRYGGQCVKPAAEPIICAQVPYQGRPVDSITQHGAGALWIEGGRIAGPEHHHNYGRTSSENGFAGSSSAPFNTPSNGRWPANFALVHTPRCCPLGTRQVRGISGAGGTRTPSNYEQRQGMYTPGRAHPVQHYASPDGTEVVQAWECADGCPVASFDAQAGKLATHSTGTHAPSEYSNNGMFGVEGSGASYGSSMGSASRFFYTADWALEVAEQLAQADPVRYEAKASRGERDAGLAHLPAHHLPIHNHEGRDLTNLHNLLPGGARARVERGEAARQTHRNVHPTVKPIALARWLATLLLPPAAYAPRRILVPFAGAGSEGIGALLAGWEEMVMIEQSAEYCAIAEQRLAWWRTHDQPSLWPGAALEPKRRSAPPQAETTLPLFAREPGQARHA